MSYMRSQAQCSPPHLCVVEGLTIRVHLQLTDQLRACGFIVRWIERDWIHPVWSARLFAGTAIDADSLKAVRKQVRRALREVGLWVEWDGVTVSISGKLIVVAFVHRAGFPGRVSFSSKWKAEKPGVLRDRHCVFWLFPWNGDLRKREWPVVAGSLSRGR